MRFGVVRHLVTRARGEDEGSAILKFGVQFTFKTQEDVPFAAPVVCQVAGRVFHHPHADAAKLLRPPCGNAGFTLVFSGFDLHPIRGAKGDVIYVHQIPLFTKFGATTGRPYHG